MQSPPIPPNVWIIYAGVILFVGLVLFLRLRRMSQMRPLKIEQLWVVPALYAAVAAYMFLRTPPEGAIGWGLCAAGLAIGAALGWQRGRMMHITVDPETHVLNQKASPAALFFILALIGVRTALKVAMAENELDLHLDPLTLTDALIAMAVGVFALQRLEMYLRAKKMLEAARGGGT